MTKGYIELALAILILVGAMGSGKSLFKRLVLGQSVPDFSASTALAESSVRSMSICQAAVEGKCLKEKWEIVTTKLMMDLVTKDSEPTPWEDISKLAFTLPTDVDEVENDTPQTIKPSLLDIPISQPLPEPGQVSTEVERPEEPQEVNTITPFSEEFLDAMKEVDLDEQLVQKISKSSRSMKLMDINFVYLLDSGGQPPAPFREMLPHFVHKSSAFVLLQKLNER